MRLCRDSLVSNRKVPKGPQGINKCKQFLLKIKKTGAGKAGVLPALTSPSTTCWQGMFSAPRQQPHAAHGCRAPPGPPPLLAQSQCFGDTSTGKMRPLIASSHLLSFH